MASISRDDNGHCLLQIVCPDKVRRSVRLGKMTQKQADQVRLRVEAIDAARRAKLPLDPDTASWVGAIGDDLARKLAAVGVIPERRSQTVGPFLDGYLTHRAADCKGGTLTNLRTVSNDVRGYFGDGHPLRDITEEKAIEFRTHYMTREPKLAAATVARRLKTVKLFFDHARRLKLVPSNPFVDLKAASVIPEANKHYVSAEDTKRLLGVCDPVWRLMVALSRFAGLRCPSEVLLLRWESVDWDGLRMTVDSPKTEHHPGKAYRVVPIFPELRPFLEEAWELAAEGAEYVVSGPLADRSREKSKGPQGWTGVSLATRLAKLIRRAGLTEWPRPFHNMRASCETDLMQSHPIHVVCSWLGNTPAVAMRHYLTVRDSDFEKAINPAGHQGHQGDVRGRVGNDTEVGPHTPRENTRHSQQGAAQADAVVMQKALRTAAAASGPVETKKPEPLAGVRVSPLLTDLDRSSPVVQVGDTGFEPVTSSV